MSLYNALLSLVLSLGFTSIGVHFKEQQDPLPALLHGNHPNCPEGWIILNREKWKCVKVIVLPLVTASTAKKLCDIAAESAVSKNKNGYIFNRDPKTFIKNTASISANISGQQKVNFYHSMLTIQSMEEQNIINNILFNPNYYNVTSGVWLGGIQSKSKRFQWIDGANFNFTNWAEENPFSWLDLNGNENENKNGRGRRREERKCIRMIPPIRFPLDIRIQGQGQSSSRTSGIDGIGAGKWQVVDCESRNAVVCQFSIKVSPSDIQTLFLEFQKNITKQLGKEEQRLNATHKLVQDLEKRIDELKMKKTEAQNVETHLFQ